MAKRMMSCQLQQMKSRQIISSFPKHNCSHYNVDGKQAADKSSLLPSHQFYATEQICKRRQCINIFFYCWHYRYLIIRKILPFFKKKLSKMYLQRKHYKNLTAVLLEKANNRFIPVIHTIIFVCSVNKYGRCDWCSPHVQSFFFFFCKQFFLI